MNDAFEEFARKDLIAKAASPEKAAEVVAVTYGGPVEALVRAYSGHGDLAAVRGDIAFEYGLAALADFDHEARLQVAGGAE